MLNRKQMIYLITFLLISNIFIFFPSVLGDVVVYDNDEFYIASEDATIIFDTAICPLTFDSIDWNNTHIIFNSTTITTDVNISISSFHSSNWFNYTVVGVGTQEIDYSATSFLVYFDGVLSGSGFSASGTTLTVTDGTTDVSIDYNGSPPTNDAFSITNPDGTTNDVLYAQKKIYYLTIDVTDPEGFSDITTIDAEIYSTDSQMSAVLRFNEDTATFSELSGDTDQLDLITGSCSNTSSGTTLNVTFAFKIEWGAHETVTEESYMVEITTTDMEANTDIDSDFIGYFCSEVTIINFAVGDGRDSISSSNLVGGNVRYDDSDYTTPANNYAVPSAEFNGVSIYDNLDNNLGTDTTISFPLGTFSATIMTPSTVGLWTLNPYIDMVDATYTDKEFESINDTLITDQIEIVSLSSNATVVGGINLYELPSENAEVYLSLKYDYDDAEVNDGSVSLETDNPYAFDDVALTYNGTLWVGTIDPNSYYFGSPYAITFNQTGVSGNTYVITTVNQTGSEITLYWDGFPIFHNMTVSTSKYNIVPSEIFIVNATIQDPDGFYDVKNVSVGLSNSLTLLYDAQADVFSLVDPNNIAKLASGSDYYSIGDPNDGIFVIQWKLSFYDNATSYGTYSSNVGNSSIYDVLGLSDNLPTATASLFELSMNPQSPPSGNSQPPSQPPANNNDNDTSTNDPTWSDNDVIIPESLFGDSFGFGTYMIVLFVGFGLVSYFIIRKYGKSSTSENYKKNTNTNRSNKKRQSSKPRG